MHPPKENLDIELQFSKKKKKLNTMMIYFKERRRMKLCISMVIFSDSKTHEEKYNKKLASLQKRYKMI
jgi:hypothetical protein